MAQRRITDRDRMRFTEGDCLILAEELSAVTGYPVYSLRSEWGHDLHAFVLMPGRKALDVTGTMHVQTMVAKWGALGYMRGAWDGLPESFRGSRRRARQIAPLLAEQARG